MVFLLKKVILVVVFIIGSFFVLDRKEAMVVRIPDEAIRFRVIASSTAKEDQDLKMKVKDEVGREITILLDDAGTIDEARNIIAANLDHISQSVSTVVGENASYNVNFGDNYFPKKVYKGVNYDEGYYESLVITLGEGQGNNWWCVLFPPLCLLEATEEESSEVEYRFFVKDLIDKYF